MPLGRITLKAPLGRPPSSKRQEVPPWYRALKPSHAEVFSQDTNLVREVRREFFSKHSSNFTTEGVHNFSEIFKQMARSADLWALPSMKSRHHRPDLTYWNKWTMFYDLYPKVWSFSGQYPFLNLLRLWDWWEYMNRMPFAASVAWPTTLGVERRARTRGPLLIIYALCTSG